MIFRKATLADTEAVTAIYDGAKKILRDSGIPQWQGPIPGKASFTEDVESGAAYVVEDDDRVIATIQIIDNEPYYDNVENGAWKDANALVAHHVAVSNDCRKHGVAGFMLENVAGAEQSCQSQFLENSCLGPSGAQEPVLGLVLPPPAVGPLGSGDHAPVPQSDGALRFRAGGSEAAGPGEPRATDISP